MQGSKQNGASLTSAKAQQMASVARLYQSQQPIHGGQTNTAGSNKEATNTSGNYGAGSSQGGSIGPAAPKISQNKSPGKTFKRVGSQSNGTLMRKSLLVKPSF